MRTKWSKLETSLSCAAADFKKMAPGTPSLSPRGLRKVVRERGNRALVIVL